ncbi:MAG: hypothetical protein ACPG77_06940, partial [Nannocystaceae bacterium]
VAIDTGEVPVDAALSRLQQSTEDSLRLVLGVALLDGVAVQAPSVVAAGTVLEHGLGRVPVGWLVTDDTGGSRPFRSAWDETTITLNAASSAWSGAIWVF